MPKNVVIIGAGFGGLEAAKALRGADVRVTVIDKSNHHLFQPLLYQVATAGLSPADIAAPIRSILHGQKNTEVVMGEVVGVDTATKQVILKKENRSYDYLIIATGAKHGYFGHENWAKYAPGLKSISDATTIRRSILEAFESAELEENPEKKKALMTFVLIGAGPTGVELAGAISELAQKALASDFRHIKPSEARVILIEASPRILASFPEDLSVKAARALQKLGVEIKVNTRVTNIDSGGAWIGETRVESKTMIWAAGVMASPAAKWLNAEKDRAGRIVVQKDLSVPGFPDIFVIGDTSIFIQDGRPLPGVSPVAMQQGRFVAKLIGARASGSDKLGRDHLQFRYRDKGSLATVGRSFAVAQFGSIHISGFFAWVAWLGVHIYYLIGFRNRLLVFIQWAWAYITFQRGARLIVSSDKGVAEI